MKKILEELWYGNLCPSTEGHRETKRMKELMDSITDYHGVLQSTFTDQQRNVFEKFDDCFAELTDINEREVFVYAFRLGVRFAFEVIGESYEE